MILAVSSSLDDEEELADDETGDSVGSGEGSEHTAGLGSCAQYCVEVIPASQARHDTVTAAQQILVFVGCCVGDADWRVG